MLFGSALRMDMANQSVFLDAANLPLHQAMLAQRLEPIAQTQARDGLALVNADNAELSLWKHILPAFAERCRSWQRRPTCRYLAERKRSLTIENGKPFMCSYGLGCFPDGYLGEVKEMEVLRKSAVRIAVPVVYSSPISKDKAKAIPTPPVPTPGVGVFGIPGFPLCSTSLDGRVDFGGSNVAHTMGSKAIKTPRLVNLDAKKGTCFECGSETAKEGGILMKCGGCKFAQYCLKECQKANWHKEHKALCKQLKGSDAESR